MNQIKLDKRNYEGATFEAVWVPFLPSPSFHALFSHHKVTAAKRMKHDEEFEEGSKVWRFFLTKTLVKKLVKNGWAPLIERSLLWQSLKSNFSRGSHTTTNWTQERGENDSDNNLFYHRKIDLLVLQKNRGTFASDTDSADHPNYEKVDFTILVLILDSSFMVKSFRLGWLNITKIRENIPEKGQNIRERKTHHMR